MRRSKFRMKLVKCKNRFCFTSIITVITVAFYFLVFSLPHDLHCSENSDDCPICNLSYFNTLCFDGQLTNNLVLQETNEKPILQEFAGFSSFSYFKLFLRSPPSCIS